MSIPFRVSSFIVLFGLLLVGACTSHPPTGDFAEITFEHLPDIRLDVDDIEVREDYVPHLAPPDLVEFWKQRKGRGRGAAYLFYAYEKRPIHWATVLRSVGGTWALVALLVPALVYALRLTAYSPRGMRDWLPFAWARSVEMLANQAGYWRGCREIVRKSNE